MVLKPFIARLGLIVANTLLVANSSSNSIGINTAAPAVTLDVVGTDAVRIAVGNTAQRPTATNGLLRFNTDYLTFEHASPSTSLWNNFDNLRGEIGAI